MCILCTYHVISSMISCSPFYCSLFSVGGGGEGQEFLAGEGCCWSFLLLAMVKGPQHRPVWLTPVSDLHLLVLYAFWPQSVFLV